jgi:hypothetical protein
MDFLSVKRIFKPLKHTPKQTLNVDVCIFYLQTLPRFQYENVEHNKFIFERVSENGNEEGMRPIVASTGPGSSPRE